MTESAAAKSGTLSGPSPGAQEGQAAVPRVRRRDPVPLGAGICVAAVGSVVLAALNGSYLGLTVTTGIGYAIVTVGMVLQLGYSRQLAFSQSVFMGLGASFSVLVVAEMMGVKSGLGWYLQWAQGWAAYANMYAALLVMALMCTGLITLLFRVRDRLLAWQNGLVQW